jgi:hypothetical protein
MMRWLISLAGLICACSPIIELARIPFTSEGAPLAVDATNVYSGASGIFAVPIGGGAPVLVGYPRPEGDVILPRVTAIAVDDQFVYATSQFGMWRFSKNGAVPPKRLVPDTPGLTTAPGVSLPMATDGQFVYWATYEFRGDALDLILAIDVNGAGPVIPVLSVGTPRPPYAGPLAGLSLDGNDLVFMAGARVARMPKQGGPVEELFATTGDPLAMAVDSQHIVFATRPDQSRTRIFMLPKQPPIRVVQLMETSLWVRSMAAASGRVWWTGWESAGGGSPEDNSPGVVFGCLREVDIPTGSGRTVSEDGTVFPAVAVNDNGVYWTEANKVLMVRR